MKPAINSCGFLQPLNREMWTFSRALLWLTRQAPGLFWNVIIVRKSYSLACMGYSGWLQGFQPRPLLTMGWEPARALHNYFTGGAGARRDMHTPLNVPIKKWNDHPAFCNIPTIERVELLRRSKTVFNGTDEFFT